MKPSLGSSRTFNVFQIVSLTYEVPQELHDDEGSCGFASQTWSGALLHIGIPGPGFRGKNIVES